MIDYSRPQTLMLSVGGNMIDVLVSSSNVTIQGSLESVWGIVNYAIQFNGSSYVVVDDSQTTILDDTDNIISLGSKLNLFSSLTAYTVVCWIRVWEKIIVVERLSLRGQIYTDNTVMVLLLMDIYMRQRLILQLRVFNPFQTCQNGTLVIGIWLLL